MLKIVKKWSLLTIVNEGSPLTIVNIKFDRYKNEHFWKKDLFVFDFLSIYHRFILKSRISIQDETLKSRISKYDETLKFRISIYDETLKSRMAIYDETLKSRMALYDETLKTPWNFLNIMIWRLYFNINTKWWIKWFEKKK